MALSVSPRGSRNGHGGWGVFRLSLVVCKLVILGCGPKNPPTTRPASLSERSEEALRDPFGYSPTFDKTDISGGGIGDYDKDAMRKDVDRVFNP